MDTLIYALSPLEGAVDPNDDNYDKHVRDAANLAELITNDQSYDGAFLKFHTFTKRVSSFPDLLNDMIKFGKKIRKEKDRKKIERYRYEYKQKYMDVIYSLAYVSQFGNAISGIANNRNIDMIRRAYPKMDQVMNRYRDIGKIGRNFSGKYGNKWNLKKDLNTIMEKMDEVKARNYSRGISLTIKIFEPILR